MDKWLSHIPPSTVLWGQFIVYTVYVVAIISLIAWFATRVTTDKPSWFKVSSKLFYGWIIFLLVVGVSLHITTLLTIPWSRVDLSGTGDVTQTYNITISNHQWQNPDTPLDSNNNLPVPCDELVKFSVTSTDLTYGFGVFSDDTHAMITQMQVVPGHANNLTWMFTIDGTYVIRSTEYSGPLYSDLVAPYKIVVTGCE